jgi:hypothetical protein
MQLEASADAAATIRAGGHALVGANRPNWADHPLGLDELVTVRMRDVDR